MDACISIGGYNIRLGAAQPILDALESLFRENYRALHVLYNVGTSRSGKLDDATRLILMKYRGTLLAADGSIPDEVVGCILLRDHLARNGGVLQVHPSNNEEGDLLLMPVQP